MKGTNQNKSLGKSELRFYFIRLTIYNTEAYEAMQCQNYAIAANGNPEPDSTEMTKMNISLHIYLNVLFWYTMHAVSLKVDLQKHLQDFIIFGKNRII